MSENRGRTVEAGTPAPLDGMRSADRAAHRRRGRVVTTLAALGLAALSAAGTRAVMAPHVQALEARASAARAEARDALSELAVLEQEIEQMKRVAYYSSEYAIPADLAEAIHSAAVREN
ncbi:MAG: hypothetical protein ACODAA_02805, partial [Gemmatimonadota bacterium]